jgi:hypothetical protein
MTIRQFLVSCDSEYETLQEKLSSSRTLVLAWFNVILSSLTSFIGIPNSMRILNNTSHFTESWAFSKSINN